MRETGTAGVQDEQNLQLVFKLTLGFKALFALAEIVAGVSTYLVPRRVFALFIAYQAYRFTYTHSVWLLLVTALDILVIALTWREYTYLRSKRNAA
jgi:uncharacterized membrane protein